MMYLEKFGLSPSIQLREDSKMNELQQKVSAIGVVPVIKLTNPTRDAGPLSDALCAGGVPVAEITFRAAGADEAMKIMLIFWTIV